MEKFHSVIVDPDTNSRMLLKQAATQVYQFESIGSSSNLRDASNNLSNSSKNIDVIFISQRFDNPDITAFINKCRAHKSTQDATFIIILKSMPQNEAQVAEQMIQGGDGILCEPYSVDYILEITRLATKIKRERIMEREKVGVGIIAQGLVEMINQYAYLKTIGSEAGVTTKKLKEANALLKTVSPETLTYYFDRIIEEFEKAPIPIPPAKVYSGASMRVKKKLEKLHGS